MDILIIVLLFAGKSLTLTSLVALGLIASQRPRGVIAESGGLNFQRQIEANQSGSLSSSDLPAEPGKSSMSLEYIPMRDGFLLPNRIYASEALGPPLVILVHGSGWHGMQFESLASRLRVIADVVVPDLRGHGKSPERRGDVDYIGQLEDDLADIILARRKPGQKVVLAGHSSGGGLVVRFAGGAHRNLMDRAILMAPFLKYNAPTTRKNSGGWAHVLLRRVIGLSILNFFRIRWLNHLVIIEFAFPKQVLEGPLGYSATRAYSYRLNTSYAPRNNYLEDIARLPHFLLIAGTADEAFVANEYEPVMAAVTTKGSYKLVPDVGHLDIVDASLTEDLILDFLGELTSEKQVNE